MASLPLIVSADALTSHATLVLPTIILLKLIILVDADPESLEMHPERVNAELPPMASARLATICTSNAMVP